MKILYHVLIPSLLSMLAAASQAQDGQDKDGLIRQQIASAENCVNLAYETQLKHIDSDSVFQDCIERRAIMIGMQMRYGAGNYGEIDIIDKLEGYAYLTRSDNRLIRKEAARYATAAGP